VLVLLHCGVTYSVCGTGVGHGVSSVTVGDVFVDKRALASGSILLSVLDSGLDGEDIHTVNLQTGDVLSTLVVVGESG